MISKKGSATILLVSIIIILVIGLVSTVIYYNYPSDDSDNDGDGVCGEEEFGSSIDCPNCDDNEECTEDLFDFELQQCINRPIIKPEIYEGPTGYSRFFGENLIANKINVISCFFEDEVSIEEYVNLDKDFSKFSFSCSSVTPQNKVGCQVGDEEFNRHFVDMFMRQDGDVWKVAKIEDVDDVLLN